MVIYITDKDIITELNYSAELKDELKELGFQAVSVPDVDEPSYYKHSMFEFVNKSWRLK